MLIIYLRLVTRLIIVICGVVAFFTKNPELGILFFMLHQLIAIEEKLGEK